MSAAATVEEDIQVATQLLGQVSYFQYQLPEEGMTLRLNVAIGRTVLYASTRITNPNSALHDIHLVTESSADVFVSPADLLRELGDMELGGVGRGRRSNVEEEGEGVFTDVTVFVTVEGLQGNNSFVLETTFGDTSTCMQYTKSHVHVYTCTCTCTPKLMLPDWK